MRACHLSVSLNVCDVCRWHVHFCPLCFSLLVSLCCDALTPTSHRVSLSGQDLNRCYIEPCKVVQPTVFHLKGLLQYLTEKKISPRVWKHLPWSHVFCFFLSTQPVPEVYKNAPFFCTWLVIFDFVVCLKETSSANMLWSALGLDFVDNILDVGVSAWTGLSTWPRFPRSLRGYSNHSILSQLFSKNFLPALCHALPQLVCDFHGHSRRKNVFMFGCGVGNSSKDASRKLTEEEVRNYQTDASRQNSKSTWKGLNRIRPAL